MARESQCTLRFACLVFQASTRASSVGSPQDPLLQSSSPLLLPLWAHLWAWRSADDSPATDSTTAPGHDGLYARSGNDSLPCCSSVAVLASDRALSLRYSQDQAPVSTWYRPTPSSTARLRLPTVALHDKLQLSSLPFIGKRVRSSCHSPCPCLTPCGRRSSQTQWEFD